MQRLKIAWRAGKPLFAIAVAAALVATPAGFLDSLDLGSGTALAKGGNGGGGGNGGKGGGNSGNDKAGATDAAGHGKSASAAGRSKAEAGKNAAALGSLNASHASPTARANAAPTSRVGQLGAYESALAAGDLEAAAQALAGAANKEITPEVVAEVNTTMGIVSTPEEEAEVAARAEAARTAEPTEDEEEVAGETTEEEQIADEAAEEDSEEGTVASAAADLLGDSATQ